MGDFSKKKLRLNNNHQPQAVNVDEVQSNDETQDEEIVVTAEPTPSAPKPQMGFITNRLNYAVPVSYFGDTIVVPPRGRLDKVDKNGIQGELKIGLVFNPDR